MADEGKEGVTLESLQAQIIEQADKLEKLEAEKVGLADQLKQSNESLKKSREINAKFFAKGVNTEEVSPVQEEVKPETQDEFIDSFLKGTAEEMKKIYGAEYFGNTN